MTGAPGGATAGRPPVRPMLPVATGLELPWDAPSTDPVSALASARGALGDTFLVDSGEDRYLFTFSPAGVAALYGLPEERASKAVADWRMLRRKLPDEIFAGRRTLPHQLFRRDDVHAYLVNLGWAIEVTTDELGDGGEVDVFAMGRRLGHRVGLASWAGPGCAQGERFEHLVDAFDRLDGADAFVHPDRMAAVGASGRSSELQALEAITSIVRQSLDELPGKADDHPLFSRMAASWADEPAEQAAVGLGRDVALVHVASMSNLFAALGWYLVDLLDHPAAGRAIGDGDAELAERAALESIRLAQRSIMSRFVLRPVPLPIDERVIEVPAGITVATLLPLTNTTPADGLAAWDPDRWRRHRLVGGPELAAAELVTTFGHGRHSCPARAFSLSAMTMTARQVLARYTLEAGWAERPRPVAAQIGGVARAASACPVRYNRRAETAGPAPGAGGRSPGS